MVTWAIPNLLILALIAIATGSPFALDLLHRHVHADWVSLSNVGQSYGAIGAVISATALVGVASSLVMQARQINIARLQGARETQIELMRIRMENPSLL